MEPETLIHHLVSPICILCSTQTDIDFRVLCQLSICIDLSGAILGMSKFLLRFSHLSASRIYQFLGTSATPAFYGDRGRTPKSLLKERMHVALF